MCVQRWDGFVDQALASAFGVPLTDGEQVPAPAVLQWLPPYTREVAAA